MKKKKFNFSTTQLIMFSFLIGILAGSIILTLPVCSADHQSVPYLDALFTAATSICVTGLVTLPTVSAWSIWGQIVILILIQMGGLGVITVMAGFMISLHRKMGLKDRMLIQDAFNLNSLSGIVKFIKKVLLGTMIVEACGSILSMTVFVPQYGAKGIWISVFHSISAFCNAGIDIMSENSLCAYVKNPMINFVTVALIMAGGIGYIVWWDVLRVLKNFRKKRTECFRDLTLHSKIVLGATAVLLLSGTAAFLVFEYNNPLTMKDFSFFEKVQASFFQSVTTRTAGFAALPQQNLTNASAVVSLLLMVIGGSPVGTAGGIKTTTVTVLFLAALAAVKGEDEVVLFHRTVKKQAVGKAVAVVSISFTTLFLSTLLLSATVNADLLDIVYETVSATATVGLTRNFTPQLNAVGKWIIITTMYLGRVGPISLVIAFNTRYQKKNIIKNPTAEISIG